jgi:hypothetical protein
MKIGDLVIEKRLIASRPFHQQLSMVVEIIEQPQRKVMVQSLTTGGIYWLYFDGVELCK